MKNQQQVEKKEAEDGTPKPDYSNLELDYRKYLIQRLTYTKDQYSETWNELDGMDAHLWYDTNAKAGNSFNPPKVNKEDTKIVTGTTLEKENILLNSLLSLNFEPDIEAFDADDLPVVQLGNTMEAMVRKSNILEDYADVKRRLIYKELLDQGTCFVEEVENQYIVNEKDVNEESMKGVDPSKMEWSQRSIKIYDECERNLLPGNMVFLGNLREFIISKQPYLFTVEYIPYSVAKAKFGDWARFKNVPKKVVQTVETQRSSTESSYRQWRLYDIQIDFVEVIKYQDKCANEYMVMLNGEMMFKPGFPLSKISGDGDYTISKGDVEPMSGKFALSKSFPAKTKVAQAVLDEFLRLFILKTQKSTTPPMAYKGGQMLSRNIFFPARLTPNLNPDDLKEIGENKGITSGEVAGYDLVKGIVDEMTVSSQFQALETKTKTATQTLEDKKQNLIKIGMAVLGVMNFEKQMTYRRLYNLLNVWTKPIDKKIDDVKGEIQNIYRSFSIPAEIGDTTGLQQIKMTDNNTKTSEEILKEEDDYEAETGTKLEVIYLNPKILKMIKNRWYVEMVQTEKNTSEYKKILFMSNLQEAMAVWGPESINLEALKVRWAELSEENLDTYFVKNQPSMPMMTREQAGPGSGSGLAEGMQTGTDNLLGAAK